MFVTQFEVLSTEHSIGEFNSGERSLDDWLKSTAAKAQKTGTSQVYLCLTSDRRVVGFHALAAGSVSRAVGKGWLARNAPDPVPTIFITRLAVDEEFQGRGIGTRLIADAVTRALQASEIVGAKAVCVNPISDGAREFYLSVGFQKLPNDPTLLYLKMDQVRESISAVDDE